MSASTPKKTASLKERIAETLEKDVKPYLAMHGGDVAVEKIEDGIITLNLKGACKGCTMAAVTFQMGVEQLLIDKFGEDIEGIEYA